MKRDLKRHWQTRRHGKGNLDLLLVGAFIAGWFLLQSFVLPGLGVST
jgi:hypothetical protein